MKTVMCYTAGQTTKGAVAIRKPAGAGNGYRVCWMGALRKYESPVPPLCGDTGPEKRLKVFSDSVQVQSSAIFLNVINIALALSTAIIRRAIIEDKDKQ